MDSSALESPLTGKSCDHLMFSVPYMPFGFMNKNMKIDY